MDNVERLIKASQAELNGDLGIGSVRPESMTSGGGFADGGEGASSLKRAQSHRDEQLSGSRKQSLSCRTVICDLRCNC